jgi:polysaccharide export outer membrane protein
MIHRYIRTAATSIAGALALALANPPTADGQVAIPLGSQPPDTVDGAAEASAAPASSLLAPGPRTILEGPISRTEYLLGPGDVLTLALVGFRSQVLTGEVAPEGTIVIPQVGVVRVGGMNLDEAERVIAGRVRRYYADSSVTVTLSALRSFKVFLVGNVPGPGAREATAVTRISEILNPVNRDGIIQRNIIVRRANGTSFTVDLASFLRTGDLTQNPTLREGDVITVPPIERRVTITGRVSFPGAYEFRPGETMAGLLTLANGGGPFPADAGDTVRLQRFTDSATGELHLLARADIMEPGAPARLVEPFDAFFIPRLSHFKETLTATISGEVRRPGEYPIQPGVTTIGELVAMAGGLTEDASLLNAELRREPPGAAGGGDSQLETIPPGMLSRDELRIRQVTGRADAGMVVMDLRDIAAGGESAADVRLRDGDRLLVPPRRNEVVVIGAVMNPGMVPFEPGQPIDHYVGLTGGYSRRADRGDVSVLRGPRGHRLTRSDVVAVAAGDQIVVPFEEPKTFLERVQTVDGIVGTVSGFILAVVALDRLWN